MKHTYFVVFILSQLLLQAPTHAQDYYFKQISIQEGISQSTVQSILCDYKQTLWFGTKDGLNRYDGYELKNYFTIAGDSSSIPGNNIFFIAEDAAKNLWIGTQHGVCQYVEEQDHFIPLLIDGNPVYSRSYALTEKGIVFIGNGTIYQYLYRTKQLTQTPILGEESKKYFTQIHPWDKQNLLIAGRLTSTYLLNIESGRAKPFAEDNIRNITAMYVDNKRQVYLAQYNKGFCILNAQGKRVKEYSTTNSKLNNNIILSFLPKENKVWIATDGGGINILNLATNEITSIEHIPGEGNTLPVNSISYLYQDKEENVWAGSIRGGAFGIRNVNMKTYTDVQLGSTNGLSDKSIVSLFEDSGHTLWVGTDGGGINSFNPSTNKFKHFTNTYKEKVSSIYELTSNELLISVFGKGLFRFNKQSELSTPLYIINRQMTDSIYSVGVPIIIQPGKKDEIYLLGRTIYLLNTRTQIVKALTLPYQGTWMQPFYHSKNYCYLWGEKSIFKLDYESHSLTVIWNAEEKQRLSAACFDGKQTIYLGGTTGLFSYNIVSRTSKVIHSPHFNSITAIYWEKPDRIWIGARNKLFAFNPQENQFSVFSISDGMLPNELLSRPMLSSFGGDIYMGGSMGLLRICKNNIPMKFSMPELVLSRFEQNRELINLKKMEKGGVSLPWDFGNVQISFIVKEQNYFRERRFKYTIQGATYTVLESNKPTLTLTALPPGQYTISAQCDTQNGEWTESVVYATFTVNPPWWKSYYALFIYMLIVSSCTLLAIRYYTIKNKKRLQGEMKEHEQRVNEEKIQFLININHELRTPLTLIYAPLKRLIDNQAPSQENSQLRSVFRQAQRMKNIINMVLDIRKMEVGKGQLDFQPHAFNEWIRLLTNDFMPEFKAKEIDLILKLDDSIDQLIFDQDKCEKAFTNLLMNALKFSDSHGCVTIATLQTTTGVKLSITDQGIGLGEYPEQLFQRFHQGNHNRGGTGIGLSYSKLMIEMQGGKIGANNNKNGGSTFFFELPQRSNSDILPCESKPYINELLSPKQEDYASISRIETKQYSLLIVEDEPELRQFLKEFFTQKFKRIYTAQDGKEGFELVINRQPDLVVSDVMMPTMNGYELCQSIKNDLRCSHIPVILLTAREDNNSTMLGYKTGADAYLPKPFDSEILMSVIETQLRNREYVKNRYKDSNQLLTQDATFSNADEIFLDRMNKVIENCLIEREFDVVDIAQRMNMSRSALYEKMHKLIGVSIGEYVDRIRMIKAEKLIINSDLPLQEIADKCGFSTPRYFSRVFKSTYGSTPSKYRTTHGTYGKPVRIEEKEKSEEKD